LTRRVRLAGAAIVGLAAVAIAVPWPAAGVEAVFSSGMYPPWQRAATSFTNLLPFALFDLVIATVIGTAIAGTIAGWRRTPGSRLRRVGASAASVVVVASAVYLWFLLAWGLNYQRVPLATRVGLDRSRATPAAAARFAEDTVREINRLHPLAHAQPWPDRASLPGVLRPAFAAALGDVRAPAGVVPGEPKRSILQPYLRWAGVDGVTNPFVPEVVVNADLLPIEVPFTLAHEWGHLAGLAHEAEASYLGWKTCLRGNEQTRYSARLWVIGHALAALPRPEQVRLVTALEPGPRDDLRAIAARAARSVPVVRRMSWATYDRYLKTNRVAEGLAAYDAALVLVLAGLPD
jgi:hypothetical protein